MLTREEQKALADHINYMAGNWMHEQQRLLLENLNQFSDPIILFDLIVDVYTNDGYDFPKRLILKAKQLARSVPEDHRLAGLPPGEKITIWRGTSAIMPNCGDYLRTNISWTTDKAMAIWFANRINNPNSPTGKGAVWEGTIARNKIIAFTQARNESEVLQHMNVQNPHILNISPIEWNAALQQMAEEKEQWEKRLYDMLEKAQKEGDT